MAPLVGSSCFKLNVCNVNTVKVMTHNKPLSVIDLCDECNDYKNSTTRLDNISLIWIHRVGPEIGTNAVSISKWHNTASESPTNNNTPYTFVNTRRRIEQALALTERGAHARKIGNLHGIGFAQVGDFNKHRPTVDQWNRAVVMCATLIPFLSSHTPSVMWSLPSRLRYGIPVVGHGEVHAAFGDGSGRGQPYGKWACPGRWWDMNAFRDAVRKVLTAQSTESLRGLGVRVEL